MPSMQMMMASGNAQTIQISDTQVLAIAFDPANALAGYSLESDGSISRLVNENTFDIGDWINPKIGMNQYEVLATIISGSLSSGTTGVQLNLETTRTWTLERTTLGGSSCEFRLDIRRVGTVDILDAAIITLQAEKEI